jgi:hypothetical protein
MSKQTALASATKSKKTVDPESWVSEQPKVVSAADKQTRLVVEIPADLHRQLKGKCGIEGVKIKDVIQNLLERYLAGSLKDS